jgi:hypothetical protein
MYAVLSLRTVTELQKHLTFSEQDQNIRSLTFTFRTLVVCSKEKLSYPLISKASIMLVVATALDLTPPDKQALRGLTTV